MSLGENIPSWRVLTGMVRAAAKTKDLKTSVQVLRDAGDHNRTLRTCALFESSFNKQGQQEVRETLIGLRRTPALTIAGLNIS